MFQVHHGDGTLDFELIDCRAQGQGRPGQGHREPFCLVFRGPGAPVLPQRTYKIESSHLGTLEIFIVPIGPDELGMKYEAIFG